MVKLPPNKNSKLYKQVSMAKLLRDPLNNPSRETLMAIIDQLKKDYPLAKDPTKELKGRTTNIVFPSVVKIKKKELTRRSLHGSPRKFCNQKTRTNGQAYKTVDCTNTDKQPKGTALNSNNIST